MKTSAERHPLRSYRMTLPVVVTVVNRDGLPHSDPFPFTKAIYVSPALALSQFLPIPWDTCCTLDSGRLLSRLSADRTLMINFWIGNTTSETSLYYYWIALLCTCVQQFRQSELKLFCMHSICFKEDVQKKIPARSRKTMRLRGSWEKEKGERARALSRVSGERKSILREVFIRCLHLFTLAIIFGCCQPL